jgi:hypothetical protein
MLVLWRGAASWGGLPICAGLRGRGALMGVEAVRLESGKKDCLMQSDCNSGEVLRFCNVLVSLWVWVLAVAGGPGLHAGHSHEWDDGDEDGECLVCELMMVSGGDPETAGAVVIGERESEGFADWAVWVRFRSVVAVVVWMDGRGPPGDPEC